MNSGHFFIYGPCHEKTCLLFLTTQAQTRLRIRAVWSAPSLSTFWKVSCVNLLQVKFQFSVAEETGLKPILSETPKTGFLTTRPKLLLFYCSTIKSWWLELILFCSMTQLIVTPVRLTPATPCSRVKHSTTRQIWFCIKIWAENINVGLYF